MSSAYYKSLICKYENIICSVSPLYTYIVNATSALSACKTKISENKVNDVSIDNGLLENISSTLDTLTSSLNTVVAECRTKIDYYTGLYNNALEKEKTIL